MAEALPYPFQRWPRLGISECRTALRMARRLELRPGVRSAAADLSKLVGEELRIEPRPPRLVTPAAGGRAPRLLLLLAHGLEATEPALMVELGAGLASHLVDRALGGAGAPVLAIRPLDATERGVLAYLAARAAAAHPGAGLHVLAVAADEAAIAASLGDAQLLCIPFDLHMGRRSDSMRLFVAERHLDRLPRRPPRALPSALEVELVVEAGRARLPATELAAAAVDDVLVPDELFDREASLPLRRLRGRVHGSARAHLGLRWVPEGLLVESIEQKNTPNPPLPERAREMTPTTTTRLLETVGDATLELSVEIARLRITLEDLARLGEDAVLLAGRPLLEPVVLRLGDRPWARGELVEVDGEIGVRLLEIAEADEPLEPLPRTEEYGENEEKTRLDPGRTP